MALDRMTPCQVTWCGFSSHPTAADVIHHRATVAEYAGGHVSIRLVWAEHTRGMSLDPHMHVIRTDTYPDVPLDFTPGDAVILAQVLAVLDPTEILQFARSLIDGAEVLEEAGR
ncbi:hypothetical protein [Actinomadura sp. HBU206391]|uniref:hypothetical protein n=1 Tax=Actinomadura sp. HBU206391 TaxID=2731692 RepID=UPI00164F0BA6|nr:hypothetical protein [Actinomadura sp. HBU206391]MBC6458454.1 hypothetical protein [Actinomadura sp. HBU206391]